MKAAVTVAVCPMICLDIFLFSAYFSSNTSLNRLQLSDTVLKLNSVKVPSMCWGAARSHQACGELILLSAHCAGTKLCTCSARMLRMVRILPLQHKKDFLFH